MSLFACLEQGVPTGFDGDIPLSNVFLPQGGGHPFEQSLGICHGNWSSAEADLPTLHALVEEEIANGWFLELDSLEAAQERFGDKLAIGKMSIVKAEGKKPRLVVDSTVCGTNPSCTIPETYTLPGVDDVRDSFPLRCHSGLCAGFAFDIKSAHKTVRVRDSDQGLLGVSLPKIQGPGRRWLFYRVCPFGANFSALWFQRLGSFFLRTLHLWTWLRHALLGYVDDFMLFQDQEVIGLTACMTLAFWLAVRERIVFYRLLPKMPCEKRYAVCSLFEAKVILMLCFPMLNDYRLHALHVFMFSKLHGAVAVCSLL